MRFEIKRDYIGIYPEGPQDIAYLEDTLGVKLNHDLPFVERVDVSGTSMLAYLKVRRMGFLGGIPRGGRYEVLD